MIAAERGEADRASAVRDLVSLHRQKIISVGVTTVSASETLRRSKRLPASAAQFRSRLSALEWDDLETVLGPAVVGLTYIGMCKIVSESFESERNAIWNILFPNLDRSLAPGLSDTELHSLKYKKWRNAWCDVHTVWTHINAGRDVFVTTNTRDFQRHEAKLREIGLKHVYTPREALKRLHGTS